MRAVRRLRQLTAELAPQLAAERTIEADPRPAEGRLGPLAGVTVLDLTQMVRAPAMEHTQLVGFVSTAMR